MTDYSPGTICGPVNSLIGPGLQLALKLQELTHSYVAIGHPNFGPEYSTQVKKFAHLCHKSFPERQDPMFSLGM